MKKQSFMKFIIVILIFISLNASAQVAINTDGSTYDGSAMLDVKSTTKGVLVPRMTLAQRNSISSPATGLLIYCLTDNQFHLQTGTPAAPGWVVLNSQWVSNGTALSYNSGSVGIGTTAPAAKLDVYGNLAINGTPVINAQGQWVGSTTGLVGPQGPTGPAGTNGKTILNGIIDPTTGVGTDGDFYINTATNKIFGPKTSGIWGTGVSLVGPQGATGSTGAQGAQGLQGVAGPQGATGAQGPQGLTGSNGATGATGAQGPTGATGPQGVQGPQGPAVSTSAICLSGVNSSVGCGCSTYVSNVWTSTGCEVTSNTGTCIANPFGVGGRCCVCRP